MFLCIISYVITTESEVSSFFLYLIKDNWDDKETKRFLIRSLKEKLMHLPRSSFSISAWTKYISLSSKQPLISIKSSL